jgi:hypothetical protein
MTKDDIRQLAMEDAESKPGINLPPLSGIKIYLRAKNQLGKLRRVEEAEAYLSDFGFKTNQSLESMIMKPA